MNYDKTIAEMLNVDGALAATIVDYSSGMMLAGSGSAIIDLEIVAAGCTDVMRAEMKTMNMLDLKDDVEDILITLGRQYYLLRPLAQHQGLFLCSVLDRARSNLALARRSLVEAEKVL